MDHDIIHLKLPRAMILALQQLAGKDDVSVGQIIREAISRDLTRRQKAKTPLRVDEQLVAPLRALLADDFAYAKNWTDLQTRLHQKGYQLAEAGGGLVLQTINGARICKGSEIGYGYALLMRRFNAPFPGHAHQYMVFKMLAENAAPRTAR